MANLIDVTGALEADHTSWARDPKGNLVLVLHDAEGRAIAIASYSLAQWLETLENLLTAKSS